VARHPDGSADTPAYTFCGNTLITTSELEGQEEGHKSDTRPEHPHSPSRGNDACSPQLGPFIGGRRGGSDGDSGHLHS
jgi:hypothetical protein